MNGTVDAAAAKHPLVCRIDDGVNVKLRNVATNNFDHVKNDSTAVNGPNGPNDSSRPEQRT